ncbi:hydroxyacid dehydrogenase [Histomonas meleagridis]|uniref:hydroxyacid dehydrogenase n=1 Tax=Histomonas meleagridis TaxID=135588 RepID=UPI00355999F1|nr:hydroxyacid dehydrogenase [Histomonas meleagridis]KAH0797536.1 hydroxyacid dehydrogenase [Histomonas meleagridis]
MNCNGLSGRVAGLIGTGNAARTLIKHLQSMNMKIKVWDKIDSSSSNNIQGVEYVTDLNDIAKTCDVISVHIDNSNNSNYHLINKTFFDFVQEDSIFVNTSCASVVDTQALMGAVEEKYLLVGLDTYDEEPIATNADFSLTEVAEIASSATCHIASYTKQSFEMIAKEATKIVVNFVKYGKILNQINSAIVNQQMKNITLMIRHSDALGKIVNCCTENKINIVEIKNSNLTENEDIQNCLLTIDENQIDFQETIGKLEGVIGVGIIKH